MKDISPMGLVSLASLSNTKTTQRNATSAKDATGWKTRIRSMPNSAIATKRKSRKEKSMHKIESPCKNRSKTIGRGLGFITGENSGLKIGSTKFMEIIN